VAKERHLPGVCGIDCGRCGIRNRADDVVEYFRSQNVEPDKVRCGGCRSERREGLHWSHDCKLLACCMDRKGLEFCAQCQELDSCALVKEFGESADYHQNTVAVMREMRDTGLERWLSEKGYV
jgi:hypothetical protein